MLINQPAVQTTPLIQQSPETKICQDQRSGLVGVNVQLFLSSGWFPHERLAHETVITPERALELSRACPDCRSLGRIRGTLKPGDVGIMWTLGGGSCAPTEAVHSPARRLHLSPSFPPSSPNLYSLRPSVFILKIKFFSIHRTKSALPNQLFRLRH